MIGKQLMIKASLFGTILWEYMKCHIVKGIHPKIMIKISEFDRRVLLISVKIAASLFPKQLNCCGLRILTLKNMLGSEFKRRMVDAP